MCFIGSLLVHGSWGRSRWSWSTCALVSIASVASHPSSGSNAQCFAHCLAESHLMHSIFSAASSCFEQLTSQRIAPMSSSSRPLSPMSRSRSPRTRRSADPSRPNDVDYKVGDTLLGTRLTRMWDQKAPHGTRVVYGAGQLLGAEIKVLEIHRGENYTQVRTEVGSMAGWVRIWSAYNRRLQPNGIQFVREKTATSATY